MKKFILIIFFISSCTSSFDEERNLKLTESVNVVVDIDSVYHPPARYTNDYSDYHIKLFDGKNVEWFKVSYEDYKKISLKDTLTNFMIEK